MKRHATFNDVKVYNVSAGKSLPEWTEEKKKNNTSLRYNEEYRRRIELITDFDMPTSSSQVKISPDGEYIFATGTYPPRVKIFQTSEVGLKCERYIDAEAVTFEVLSDDYQKLVLLRSDRQIEFHVKYGKYFSTRIPKFGRDLAYSPMSCDLYCACSGSDIYRLHLEQGRFLRPFETQCPAVNKCELSLQHQLLGCAGTDGRVECWDQRQRKVAGDLDVAAVLRAAGEKAGSESLECSALQFADDGLSFGVGTSSGHCLLFDLRSNKPLQIMDHKYGLPIISLNFASERNIVSADSKLVKAWGRDTGKVLTNIEPPADINNLCLWPGTGLMFMAAETHKIQTFYVPALGLAPRWCRFLDNLTEELEEEETTSVYDDYKFVTKEELRGLGLGHLIGTSVLRAYMHGYFMDMRLYKKAQAVAQPFAYETYRQEQIDRKIHEQRENRIAPVKKLPKVNRKLAERILNGSKQTKASKQEKADPKELMEDDRFSSLWSDPKFIVDEQSEEFARVNPSTAAMANARAVQREDEDSEDQEPESRPSKTDESLSFADGESSNDSDLENDEEEDDDEENEVSGNSKRAPRLVEVKEGVDGILAAGKRKKIKVSAPFGQRVESLARREAKRAARKAEKASAEKRQRSEQRAEGQGARRSFDAEMRAVKKRSAFS